ncbi:hypothetical protein K7I13_11815 [Brucepastera parasyntrophica]|uniref:hypothetical protein n=1 Tax=Brucepastera parasyntrophica TaxID=2880008 RepID=UPI00210D7F74|nr:hypothetical protein [Brucepastera parasyntrophica]ULQ59175.1 hypothetical protein K7I13_11815 [Brucepastera parasyntrophica]
MKPVLSAQITKRLSEKTSEIKYGTVSVILTIHCGRITAITYSATENTREVNLHD